MVIFQWENVISMPSQPYVCGHCGSPIASDKGYYAMGVYGGRTQKVANIYICHLCFAPTYFDLIRKGQIPGPLFGEHVKDIPFKNVEGLYNEARSCVTVNAYTAAVLCCRKLLMNIAVSKGASDGLKFIEYVEFLSDKGYVPPDGKGWVDHIRKKGNEATHEISIMNSEDAKELITFIEMLLKFIYEFPAAIQKKKVVNP